MGPLQELTRIRLPHASLKYFLNSFIRQTTERCMQLQWNLSKMVSKYLLQSNSGMFNRSCGLSWWPSSLDMHYPSSQQPDRGASSIDHLQCQSVCYTYPWGFSSSDVPARPESRKPAQAEPSEAKLYEAVAGLGVACGSGFTSSKLWAVAWATALCSQ